MPQDTLFTEHFLNEGIRETEAWANVPGGAIAGFRSALKAIFHEVADPARLDEANTELRIVRPILALLDWNGRFSVQERTEIRVVATSVACSGVACGGHRESR